MKKSLRSQDLNPGLLGGNQKCFLCAAKPSAPPKNMSLNFDNQPFYSFLDPVHAAVQPTGKSPAPKMVRGSDGHLEEETRQVSVWYLIQSALHIPISVSVQQV